MHKSDYEKHGKWFMDKAKSFKKFGFDIGEIEMDKNIGTSEDDEDIKTKHEKSIFLKLGIIPIYNLDSLIKIAKKDKDDALAILKKLGCRKITLMKTNNLNAVRLANIDVSDIGERQYLMNDEFIDKYGPFEEIDTIDLTKMTINERTFHAKNHRPAITVTILPDGRRRFRT